MKKIRLLLPISEKKTVEITTPDLRKFISLTRAKRVLRIFEGLALFLFWFYILVLPFTQNIFLNGSDTSETSVFKFLMLFVLIITGLFLSSAVLGGIGRFIDPDSFIVVLIFALVITFTGVMVPDGKVSSTFGSSDFRSLTGLTVMFLIGLFYFINYFINSRKRLLSFYFITRISFLLYGVILIVLSLSRPEILEQNLLNLSFVFLILLLGVAYSKSKRLLMFLLVLLFSFIVLSNFNTELVDYSSFTLLTFCYFIAIIPFYISFVVIKRKYIWSRLVLLKNNIQNVKSITIHKSIMNWNYIIEKLILIMVLLSPLIFLTLLLSQRQSLIDSVNFSFSQIGAAINSYFGSSFNLKIFLFGNGMNGYFLSNSFVTNIISIEGLVGILAWGGVWVYSIYKGLKLFIKQLKNRKLDRLAVFFIFILVLFPVYSLFSYAGMFMMVLWWISFSIITNYESYKAKVVEEKILPVRLFRKSLGRFGYYFRYLLSVLPIALAVGILWLILPLIR